MKTIYDYSELTGEAKDKAQQWLIECAGSSDWFDFVYEEWAEKLGELGIDICTGNQDHPISIFFSGFYSQGDGAQFTGRVNLAEFLKAHKLASKYRAYLNWAKDYGSCTIKSNGHYSHELCTSFDFDSPDDGKAYDQHNEVESLVIDTCRSYMKQIYKELETEWNSVTSEEALKEDAEANDYTFDVYGNREG
jgi:hypothetical protein